MCSPRTIGDGLECTSRYLYLHGRSLRITVEADPHRTEGVIAVRYGGDAAHPVSAQSMDRALGFTHRVIATLVGAPYGLRSVELPHPPLADSSVYESFFGVETRFRRPDGLLRMPRGLLSSPLSHGDETLRALALAYLAQQAPEPAAELAPRVRAALAQSLGAAGTYHIDSVARLLSVHPRTLQRRLAAEGTAFATILDDVRRDAARRYLVTSDLPMYQIASLLGLSEQSALSRCCRRWWGSPTRRCDAMRGRAPPPPARDRSTMSGAGRAARPVSPYGGRSARRGGGRGARRRDLGDDRSAQLRPPLRIPRWT
ncbi:AraC-like DNA-binding protein [Streptomyces sp. TLI_235]|nr:AraC family transcriptional regulator [Streptomyces sp. TLI_235]PBC75753.1 AraC-like DNA-binding protein [Streptomyces sp. TLI_235]